MSLIIENLYKSFGAHPILQGVSFSAKKGEVIAMLGTSGSGKSTLLRCINCLVIPDSGSIEINQVKRDYPTKVSAKTLQALRQKVGMVFQQYNLWSHMTVLQNLIEAPIRVLKEEKNQAIARAMALLEKVGLTPKAASYPNALSGGQQQRAAIARALMMKPEIMLFDEPTSALDPEMVGEVLRVMQTLAQEGTTMIIATHELNFAKNVANQTMFLDAGKIIEQAETALFFKQPKTKRLQQFLEAMQY